jgi:hypothetical protein
VQTKQQRIEELEADNLRLSNELDQVRREYARDLDLFTQELGKLDQHNEDLENAGRVVLERIDEVTAHRNFLSQTLSAIAFYGGQNADIPAQLASVALSEFGVKLERRAIGDEPS